jgi:glycerol-3-phosphate dehydrogenase
VTSAAERRAAALEELRTGTLDLLVIGAGIVGSRVAYEAARAGLRVGLVDGGDFGGATSSASSKLVHGGIRYMTMGRLGLARRSRSEQHALRTRVAPHLVRDLPFVLAIDRDAGTSPRGVAAGLRLYDALSGFRARSGRVVAFEEARALVPPLRGDRLTACAVLHEAQTHDGRLTLATVAGAERAGAVVCNHLRLVAVEQACGRIAGAILESGNGEGTIAVR